MRKIALIVAALLSLSITSMAFADDAKPVSYHSELFSQTGTTAPVTDKLLLKKPGNAKAGFWATNITVINASTNSIWVDVGGYPGIYDQIRPMGNDHILSDSFAPTYIVLRDLYEVRFYDTYVPNKAIVVVYGTPGYYTITVDKNSY